MRPRCQVHGYWLGRVARSSATRWVLLQGMEVRVYYGSVLITERAQPLLISLSELATGWSSADQLTYTMPEELIARLDAAAAAAAAADDAPIDARAHGCGGSAPHANDEDEDEAAMSTSPIHTVHMRTCPFSPATRTR